MSLAAEKVQTLPELSDEERVVLTQTAYTAACEHMVLPLTFNLTEGDGWAGAVPLNLNAKLLRDQLWSLVGSQLAGRKAEACIARVLEMISQTEVEKTFSAAAVPQSPDAAPTRVVTLHL